MPTNRSQSLPVTSTGCGQQTPPTTLNSPAQLLSCRHFPLPCPGPFLKTQAFWLLTFLPSALLDAAPGSPVCPLSPHLPLTWLRVLFTLDSPRSLCLCLSSPPPYTPGNSHILSYFFLFFTQLGDADGAEINGSTSICPILFFKYFFPKKIEVWMFRSLSLLVTKSKAWFLGWMTRAQGSDMADNSQGPQP